jgi:hypothetical protein
MIPNPTDVSSWSPSEAGRKLEPGSWYPFLVPVPRAGALLPHVRSPARVVLAKFVYAAPDPGTLEELSMRVS